MFQDGSVSLGSIASIPVRLHGKTHRPLRPHRLCTQLTCSSELTFKYCCFCAVTFPVVLLFSLLSQSPWNLATLAWASLLYGPVLLVTVLIHELGHSLAARRAGSEAHGILLWPLGGLAFVGHSASPKGKLVSARQVPAVPLLGV